MTYLERLHRKGRQRTAAGHRIGSIVTVVFIFLTLSGFRLQPRAAPAHSAVLIPAGSGQEVIQLVNQVRAGRGLPAYRVNSALMAAAQAQSDYQASIGSTTHTGAGGSSVTSRAIAAGYGGGASVSVTENVFGGGSATPQQAVSWWENDSLHLQTLISTRYQDVGAAVSSGFYTLVVGSVVGAPGSAETQIQPTTGAAAPVDPAATAAPIPSGVVTSTPGPDGAIIHEVQSGETIWSIAATYKVSIAEVLRINGLNANSSVIRPGQKIVIQPAGELPTATFGLTNSEGTPLAVEETPPTRAPRATRTPRPTEIAIAPVEATGAAGAAGAEELPIGLRRPVDGSGLHIDPPLAGIIGLMVVGAGLLLAGKVIGRIAAQREP